MKNNSITSIEENLFLLQDKINMMEMFLAHARENAHELQELLFYMEERRFEEKYSSLR